jgi:WD40 repeat protein
MQATVADHLIKGLQRERVSCVAISSSSQFIAFSSETTVTVIRADTFENVHTQNLSSVSYLEFSHDDSLLVSACNLGATRKPTVYIQPFDKACGTVGDHQTSLNLEGIGCVTAVKLSPDSQSIACISLGLTGGVWDAQSGQMTLALRAGSTQRRTPTFTDIMWLANRKIIALSHGMVACTCSWDASTGGLVTYIPSHLGPNYLSYEPGAGYIVQGKEVILPGRLSWALNDPALSTLLKQMRKDAEDELSTGRTHAWSKVRVPSPDERYTAVELDDVGLVVGVRTRSGGIKQHRKLEGHTEKIYCLVWAPDGQYVVSCGLDDTLRLWTVDHKVCVCVCVLYSYK